MCGASVRGWVWNKCEREWLSLQDRGVAPLLQELTRGPGPSRAGKLNSICTAYSPFAFFQVPPCRFQPNDYALVRYRLPVVPAFLAGPELFCQRRGESPPGSPQLPRFSRARSDMDLGMVPATLPVSAAGG